MNYLSADDQKVKLDKHLRNQTVDILKIVAMLMGINLNAVNAKSKRYVKKIIEKIYKDVSEDADKSEQEKKTYLIGIINELKAIMPKPNKVNTPTSSELKDYRDPDESVKDNIKVVNDGDKESDIQPSKVDQMLEEPSLTLPNKINSERQQRVINTIDLSGLTTSERERETQRERESKGHVRKRI